MSAISSQHWVRQRTKEEQSALQAKIMDRNVLVERNVVRAYIMEPPYWIAFMRLSRSITGATSTLVPALSSPG
jgi:hypothetical protein